MPTRALWTLVILEKIVRTIVRIKEAIWLTIIPLGVIFASLLHADLTTEKSLVEERKPSGH